MDKEQLIDLVVEQILKDVENEDFTAIYELLMLVPEENLIAFLPEEIQNA